MSFRHDGADLHYRDEGTGAPILFVHGFPLSGELWDEVVPRLGDGYRAIVPDLRGLGRSGASDRTTMATYAADLAALLDHLEVREPVVLVGLSMGGYVAFEFVRRFPERVRALVLANTRAAADSDDAAANRRDTAAQVQREGSAVVADSMVGKLFSPESPEELRTRWRRIMADAPPAGVAAALLAMAERPDSFDTLRSAGLPVLVVAGTDDAIVPVAEAEEMRDAVPGASLVVVPRAGHMTPVEQAEPFATALREFLQRLATDAASPAEET